MAFVRRMTVQTSKKKNNFLFSFFTCKAAKSIISSSVQSISSRKTCHLACSYNWVKRTASNCKQKYAPHTISRHFHGKVRAKYFIKSCQLFFFKLPVAPGHKSCSIWSAREVCRLLWRPAAGESGMNRATWERKNNMTFINQNSYCYTVYTHLLHPADHGHQTHYTDEKLLYYIGFFKGRNSWLPQWVSGRVCILRYLM